MAWINQGQVNGAGQGWIPPWAQANQNAGANGASGGVPSWGGDGFQSNWWSPGASGSASSSPYAQNTFAGFVASVQNAIGTLAQQFFGTSGSGSASDYGSGAGSNAYGTAAYGNGAYGLGVAGEYGGAGYADGGYGAAGYAESGSGNGGFGDAGSGSVNEFGPPRHGQGECANGACERGPSVALTDGTLSSTGDPHLAVTGTRRNAGGSTSTVDSHFDSMTGHNDLFSTNTFGDGFNVATTVTQPNATGVTTNASATATMNGGADAVSMSLAGGLQVTSGGSAVSIAQGQTVTLSGGEQVTENANGSVTIAEQNGSGSTLDTTFSNGGNGINVTAQAHDVRVAGDLVTGGSAPAAPTMTDFPRRQTF
jgi:hypothetical protein